MDSAGGAEAPKAPPLNLPLNMLCMQLASYVELEDAPAPACKSKPMMMMMMMMVMMMVNHDVNVKVWTLNRFLKGKTGYIIKAILLLFCYFKKGYLAHL